MSQTKNLHELAVALYNAQKTKTPIPPLTDQRDDLTIEDAYEIQQEVVQMKLADGYKIIGKKIGLTSKEIRKQIGVFEPDYGIITSEGLLTDGGELYMSDFIAPRIESEIVFVLGKDITKDMYPVKASDIIDCTLGVAPALEIVDSRIQDWRIKIQDTISDAASYAAIVTGSRLTPLKDLDLDIIGMAAYKNGELVQASCSAAVMGNPINAIIWLVNKMLSYGLEFKKGELLLSGSLTPVFDMQAGDHIQVKFDRLGSVSLLIR
ncbi:MAG: 2-keto-4-pentenoate hydratase [Christensenellales bacterium]|jgi:2-keto-4-pentenoate hydratase